MFVMSELAKASCPSEGMHLQAGLTRAQELIQDLAEVDQQLESLAREA